MRPWGCIILRCYDDKEGTIEDAHDANKKKDEIHEDVISYIEFWESGCLEHEIYCQNMKDYVTYYKGVVDKLDVFFPQHQTPCNLDFAHQHQTPREMQSMLDPIQDDITPDDDSMDLFCRVAHDTSKSYNPYKDVLLGDFVLVPPLHNMSTLSGWADTHCCATRS